MPDDVKKIIEDTHKAFEDFCAKNDENLKKRDVLLEEQLARINKKLDEGEAVNQKFTREFIEARDKDRAADSAKEFEAVNSRLDEVQAKLQRPRNGDDVDSDAKKYKDTFVDFVRWGDKRQDKLPQERMNTLIVGDDTGGGYLAPPEIVNDIIKAVVLYSPMRMLATVRTTANRSVMWPKRTGTFSAVWVGEVATRSENTGLTYGMEEIPANELVAESHISMQMLEDAGFDMQAQLTEEFTEQFGVAEGLALVSGSGIKKPEGILTASGTVSRNTLGATTITADGILDLKYSIKSAYAKNGTFVLNRHSIASVRKLKDSQNRYIWMPGLAEGAPNTIDGDPYVEAPDMPSEAASAKVMAYGDFKRALLIVDRISMQVTRDPFTLASTGQVKFVGRRRVGGQVVLAEAIAISTCSASANP